MRGSIVRRGKASFALILEQPVIDPTTGARKRKQRWVSFKGTRREAEAKLADLVRDTNHGDFVAPSRLTVAEWLTDWMTKVVKPTLRPRTIRTYESVIVSLKASLGALPLQQLKANDVSWYLSQHRDLSPATQRLHHAVLSGALRSAVKNGLVTKNVASGIDGLPKIETNLDALAANVWDLDDTRKFLAVAKEAGSQAAAFYSLALDSGARVSELAGVQWRDLDLDARRWMLSRQLVTPKLTKEGQPVFGPLKAGKPRRIDLNAQTVQLLRTHKAAQAELKLKNRLTYLDFNLAFCAEPQHQFTKDDRLGQPLRVQNINVGEFARLIKLADVKKITVHGMRHTCATLLLLAGESAKVVAERLGHSKIAITMDQYTHLLPAMQSQAADRLGALLHG